MGIFSEHAVLRIKQRTKMTPTDILNLISNGGALNMGTKPGIPKRHLLFYSPVDDNCFVAIQDESDGTVITVLPVDYHANLAWEVTPELEDDAKSLYANATTRNLIDSPSPLHEQPHNFVVSCRYYDANLLIKTKRLFSVPLEPYESDVDSLVSCRQFRLQIVTHATAMGIMPSMLEDIYVRIGSNPRRNPEKFIRFEDLE